MNPFRTALDAAAATTQLARDACEALWMLLAPNDVAARELDARPDGEEPLVDEPESTGITMQFENGYPDHITDSLSVFRSGGQTKQMGPRPRISTPGPRLSDSDRLDRISALLQDLTPILENIRDTLQHNTSGQGGGNDVGDGAKSSSGAPGQHPSRDQTSADQDARNGTRGATTEDDPAPPVPPGGAGVGLTVEELRVAALAVRLWLTGGQTTSYNPNYHRDLARRLDETANHLRAAATTPDTTESRNV